MPIGPENDAEPIKRCRVCDRELVQGMDVTILQRGILGPRGFVPLEDMEFFCTRTCLEEYCCDGFDNAGFEHEDHDEKD